MENKRYYIKIDGRLQEVTYDEYLAYISRKVNRESVYFICMGQVVMEVEKDIYEEHYRDLRKWKYLRSEAEHWEVSYHSMDTDLMTGEETIFDETAETVEDRAMYHIYLENYILRWKHSTRKNSDWSTNCIMRAYQNGRWQSRLGYHRPQSINVRRRY